MSTEATPFEWLEWFWRNCDFGPAHEDVIGLYEEMYTRKTGKTVPKEYSVTYEEDY